MMVLLAETASICRLRLLKGVWFLPSLLLDPKADGLVYPSALATSCIWQKPDLWFCFIFLLFFPTVYLLIILYFYTAYAFLKATSVFLEQGRLLVNKQSG